MTGDLILLAAGGTGGHLFPAEALSVALQARGYVVELATDDRALKYGSAFPARAIHTIPAGSPSGGSILSKGLAALELGRGTFVALGLLRRLRPACVVGFGGYPTVPPVLAATLLKIPTVLHDQNAVLGRANKFLAGRVSAIASGFPTLGGLSEGRRRAWTSTGNPVRPAVIEAAKLPYPPMAPGEPFRLLVTGGSQGARVFSDVVPPAIELLEPALRGRISIVQQARGEDEARVRAAYARLGVAAEVAPFFKDLPARIAGAHLVIGRAGASTVSELSVIGRPAVLVPFPFAIDQDQAANARHLGATGAAEIVVQKDFTAAWLAGHLAGLLAHPESLTPKAEAAKSAGVPDAAERLADLVIEVTGRHVRP
jgi:UDP-N-acetylglucosamine--N-acetylmuramyl-(pentapeptide) pyrophosphoryl-undecaprenol N-acetylglucosamine transferase